jgi:hypothetical protein
MTLWKKPHFKISNMRIKNFDDEGVVCGKLLIESR